MPTTKVGVGGAKRDKSGAGLRRVRSEPTESRVPAFRGPIAALALDAGTTTNLRCTVIHFGQEADALHAQAGYTTAAESKDTVSRTVRGTTGRSPYRAASPQRVG